MKGEEERMKEGRARRDGGIGARGAGPWKGARAVPPYSRTAALYDAMVGRFAFDMWRENFERLCRLFPIDASLTADVACGTGLAARYLAQRGAEVLACDIEPRMLRAASAGHEGVRFFRQDMRRLCLPRRVTLLICATDALNHLLEEEDLSMTLGAFRDALVEGGHALFDLNTLWQLREGCDSETWCFEVEGNAMRWTSRWDEADAIATLWMECEGEDGGRVVEVHRERGYEEGFVVREALRRGFRGVEVYDARGLGRPSLRTRRLQFVAWR
ncbi:MAG: class I SAM-dependent methyltransferase [Actinomycetota bacterium]|nr:class I SAM-dependent methyltransferase [Actinomycetota bacterium]